MANGQYFAVIGQMPNGSTFCYGVGSTRAGALALQRHARLFDQRFYADFSVKEVPQRELPEVLGLERSHK